MRTTLAAKLFIALTCVVVAFQIALAAGAPWGDSRLPRALNSPFRDGATPRVG